MTFWFLIFIVIAICLYSVLANLIILGLVLKIWTEYTKDRAIAARAPQ
jgi:hypothetical protein